VLSTLCTPYTPCTSYTLGIWSTRDVHSGFDTFLVRWDGKQSLLASGEARIRSRNSTPCTPCTPCTHSIHPRLYSRNAIQVISLLNKLGAARHLQWQSSVEGQTKVAIRMSKGLQGTLCTPCTPQPRDEFISGRIVDVRVRLLSREPGRRISVSRRLARDAA
jgi:hypothetical protein